MIRWRRRGSLVALVFMLSWVLGPSVHAQFEVISSAPAVETGHTDDCPTIHADGLCIGCSAFQFPATSICERAPEAAGRIAVLVAAERAVLVSASRLGVPTVRGPPSL